MNLSRSVRYGLEIVGRGMQGIGSAILGVAVFMSLSDVKFWPFVVLGAGLFTAGAIVEKVHSE